MTTWLQVAQIVSSALAGIGLIFTAIQMSWMRSITGVQALQKFSDDANAREAALVKAKDDYEPWSHAFNEWLNFLELYACAHNEKLLMGGAVRKLIGLKLMDSWIELENEKSLHDEFKKAVDRSSTFAELRKFVSSHKKEINTRKAERSESEGALENIPSNH